MDSASPSATARPTPPEKPALVRVLEQNPDFCCAQLRNIAALVWNYPPTLHAFERSAAAMRPLLDEHPAGVGILTVLRSGDSSEESALVRQANARRIKDSGGAIAAVATVDGRNDLFGTINRLPLRLRFPLARGVRERYFGRTGDACAWLADVLCEKGKPAPGAEELASSVDWLLDFYPGPAT
ncbi:MAG: hypothetical protein ACOX6T_27325 [Myxococcales bacterium]|jgi:hypothetical protein